MWPTVEPRVRSLLANKGVPPSRRDDIVQETGLRLFTMWERVDQSEPPSGLAITIALNLLRDEARRYGRAHFTEVLPEMPSSDDVESAGIARLELHRVKEALGRLSSARREVLLAEVGGGGEHLPLRGAAAVKMLRMRARRELHALLDKAQGIVALGAWRMRQSTASVHQLLARFGSDTSGAQTAVAGSLVAVALLGAPASLLGSGGAADAAVGGARDVLAQAPSASIADEEARSTRFRYRVDKAEQTLHRGDDAARESGRRRGTPARPAGSPAADVGGRARVEALGTSHEVGVEDGTASYTSAGSPSGCSASCMTGSDVRVEVCVTSAAGAVCAGAGTDDLDPAKR